MLLHNTFARKVVILYSFCYTIIYSNTQRRRQKIFQRGGATEKIPKISKKYRKIALFSLFQGRPTVKKTEK